MGLVKPERYGRIADVRLGAFPVNRQKADKSDFDRIAFVLTTITKLPSHVASNDYTRRVYLSSNPDATARFYAQKERMLCPKRESENRIWR